MAQPFNCFGISCPLLAGSFWRTQVRPKQQTEVMRRFTTGILRFLKSQAITLRRSATRLRLFVRLLREQSGSSTVMACAFNRLPDFSPDAKSDRHSNAHADCHVHSNSDCDLDTDANGHRNCNSYADGVFYSDANANTYTYPECDAQTAENHNSACK